MTCLLFVSVAFVVCLERLFTSVAATANPLPTSPALAASMLAFNVDKFVCTAIIADRLSSFVDISRRLPQLFHHFTRSRGIYGSFAQNFTAVSQLFKNQDDTARKMSLFLIVLANVLVTVFCATTLGNGQHFRHHGWMSWNTSS
jgi:hypothetical protein